ncbi:hypothetical protein F4055_08540 [Candidatus Poribacteria bacterium]|nr:hypothetical protein [Candidatus Poribacteria bacterium]MYK18199.1 hypothetical protein [Candidatus Poribacteria bacterium]
MKNERVFVFRGRRGSIIDAIIVATIALTLIMTLGCGEGMNMAGDVIGGGPSDTEPSQPTESEEKSADSEEETPADAENPLPSVVMMGEMKGDGDDIDTTAEDPKVTQPDSSTPTKVIELGYYLDEHLTQPVSGDKIFLGEPVYTKVVFSGATPVIVSDGSDARPMIHHPDRERRGMVTLTA